MPELIRLVNNPFWACLYGKVEWQAAESGQKSEGNDRKERVRGRKEPDFRRALLLKKGGVPLDYFFPIHYNSPDENSRKGGKKIGFARYDSSFISHAVHGVLGQRSPSVHRK